jgi:putative oxidoreductase
LTAIFLFLRIIIGGYGIYIGLNQFIEYAVKIQYAKNRGISFHSASQGIAGFLPLLGGISIASGIYPYAGMMLLAGFLVPVAFLIHRYRMHGEAHLQIHHAGRFRAHTIVIGIILVLFAIPSSWGLTLMP